MWAGAFCMGTLFPLLIPHPLPPAKKPKAIERERTHQEIETMERERSHQEIETMEREREREREWRENGERWIMAWTERNLWHARARARRCANTLADTRARSHTCASGAQRPKRCKQKKHARTCAR